MQQFSKHGSNNFGVADGMEPQTSQNRVVHNQTSATHTVEHDMAGEFTGWERPWLTSGSRELALHYLSSHYLHIKRCLK